MEEVVAGEDDVVFDHPEMLGADIGPQDAAETSQWFSGRMYRRCRGAGAADDSSSSPARNARVAVCRLCSKRSTWKPSFGSFLALEDMEDLIREFALLCVMRLVVADDEIPLLLGALVEAGEFYGSEIFHRGNLLSSSVYRLRQARRLVMAKDHVSASEIS